MPNLESRFSVAPSIVMKQRSTFDMPYTHLTTGNFGKLIPFYVNEVLPGDTFDIQTRLFSRMSTPLYPVMDDAWINYYYFFVPARLVWDRFAEFLGENKYTVWTADTEYIIPHRNVISKPGSLADHMGIPTYTADVLSQFPALGGSLPSLDVNFLPFRAYWLIWNEWFRNQNTTDPVLVNTGDSVTSEELARVDTLLNVSKPFDMFTSVLPFPQKGDAVDLPLTGNAIVKTSNDQLFVSDLSMTFSGESYGLYDGVSPLYLRAANYDSSTMPQYYVADGTFDEKSEDPERLTKNSVGAPSNLYADLSTVSAVTVNQLRQAFQMQRLLELQARSGTRYTEIIRASFSVVSPDARLQRPEYLGGTKVHVQMQQVTQQSETSVESPLGRVGAYSKTVSFNKDFTQSFTEHGYIIGVMCARHNLTYQQGLHKMWTRRGRYDFYWPTFAHIGEQPIYNRELFAIGSDDQDSTPFGYQEAWAEYRYKPNEVTGAFRSTVGTNLDEWHYADLYAEQPILSAEWMEATGVDVDRTLAVTSDVHDQLLFDIRVDAKATRVMPLYSIPGLIDHF